MCNFTVDSPGTRERAAGRGVKFSFLKGVSLINENKIKTITYVVVLALSFLLLNGDFANILGLVSGSAEVCGFCIGGAATSSFVFGLTMGHEWEKK